MERERREREERVRRSGAQPERAREALDRRGERLHHLHLVRFASSSCIFKNRNTLPRVGK